MLCKKVFAKKDRQTDTVAFLLCTSSPVPSLYPLSGTVLSPLLVRNTEPPFLTPLLYLGS